MSFEGYQTRYRPGLDLVLRGISVDISGGEKVYWNILFLIKQNSCYFSNYDYWFNGRHWGKATDNNIWPLVVNLSVDMGTYKYSNIFFQDVSAGTPETISLKIGFIFI